ncbi:hypothetical protein BIY24_07145 [Halobacteriovorax marinus]|uniref:FecR family protein n=1 Tax=Halobacteriovorax marinus TaxID=97084 RepID=UPI000BC33920|nr:FecR family protein [Halobacteriovorax marinus]ATH07727.1 hypothetical protein BIY24_07145 [Halobacteriovorax marinus]
MKFLITFFILLTSTFAQDFTIQRYKGEVFVNSTLVSSANEKTIEIKIGDTLAAKGKKSFLQVKSNKGSTFLVRDGELVLQKFNSKLTVVKLLKGKFFHFLDTEKNKRSFIVKTETASLGIRGTKYMVEASDEKTYLCVCEGKVAIKSNQTKKLYFTNAGEDIDILSTMADFKVKKASLTMIDMTAKEFSDMGHPL